MLAFAIFRSTTTVARFNGRHAVDFSRRLLSKHYSHEAGGLHFENHRPEDAMPFKYDSKLGFAVKLAIVTILGLGTPVAIVAYHMQKQ